MRLLLDSQILIWAMVDDDRLRIIGDAGGGEQGEQGGEQEVLHGGSLGCGSG